MKKKKENLPRRIFEDLPWMEPANEIRDSAEYKSRRRELVAALRAAKRLEETKKFKVADWKRYLWELNGPAPDEDKDAAGRPRNRQWWLHYRISVDADEIRREAFGSTSGHETE